MIQVLIYVVLTRPRRGAGVTSATKYGLTASSIKTWKMRNN